MWSFHGLQAKGKQLASAWDELPDLQFQSDNPHSDFKRKAVKPMMLDQGTMTDPTIDEIFPQPPARAALRHLSVSSISIARTVSVAPITFTNISRISTTGVRTPIPPLPFSHSTGSLLETPVRPDRAAPRIPRPSSIASSTSSSSLSSGPFSESDFDEAEEIVLQPSTYRPQSVAQHTRHASFAIAGRTSEWGIHEIEAGPSGTRPHSK